MSTPPSTPPPRKFGLKWTDFQYEGDLEHLFNTTKQRILPQTSLSQIPLDHTIAKLREERFRFMKKVPNDLNSKICCPRDRSAVLDVYAEALDSEKINSKNHEKIYAEANVKIRTILSIISAGPRNDAFYKGLLSPIESLYARPRIEFRKDKYGHRAAARIQEWRNDGWPNQYPRNAIELEKTRKGLDEEKEEDGEGAESNVKDKMEWMSSRE